MLVPFLVFAIGVSHGAQKMNGIMQDVGRGTHRYVAARYTFRRLFVAGLTALLTNAFAFAVMLLIDIPAIRDLAITTSIGVLILIFTKLILPLSVPALASFAIFQFLWLWNDYLVALVFLGEKNQTVTIAVARLVGEKGQDWHLMTSAAFISMILPLLVFLGLQRYFVRGMMAGSVKG